MKIAILMHADDIVLLSYSIHCIIRLYKTVLKWAWHDIQFNQSTSHLTVRGKRSPCMADNIEQSVNKLSIPYFPKADFTYLGDPCTLNAKHRLGLVLFMLLQINALVAPSLRLATVLKACKDIFFKLMFIVHCIVYLALILFVSVSKMHTDMHFLFFLVISHISTPAGTLTMPTKGQAL